MKKYKINGIIVEGNTCLDAISKIRDSVNYEYLLSEERKAVEDYKKAISETNDKNELYVLSHILKEEAHHIELLENLQKGKVTFSDSIKDDDLVDKYQQIVDRAIELFGRIGAGLYDELDENGLWVDDRNNKYIVKRK